MTVKRRAALFSACTLMFLVAGTAFAHASLVESDPADGATIQTPYTLSATYDEELTPNGSGIIVKNAAGDEVATGTVSEDDDKVMTVDLPSLPPGEYVARWTAVTADDLGVTRGEITFMVAAAATPTPKPTATAAPSATATVSPTASPAPPTPMATEPPGGKQPVVGSNDALIALVIAAVVIAGIAIYLRKAPR
jgi:copper resistance protein C